MLGSTGNRRPVHRHFKGQSKEQRVSSKAKKHLRYGVGSHRGSTVNAQALLNTTRSSKREVCNKAPPDAVGLHREPTARRTGVATSYNIGIENEVDCVSLNHERSDATQKRCERVMPEGFSRHNPRSGYDEYLHAFDFSICKALKYFLKCSWYYQAKMVRIAKR